MSEIKKSVIPGLQGFTLKKSLHSQRISRDSQGFSEKFTGFSDRD